MVLDTLHLFAGAGGGILADRMLGHRPVGAVEIEAYPRKVLLARQLDGSLPKFPIWDDVTTFRSDNPGCASYIARLRKLPNLCISGGFPCQDISAAGKGAGITGERSGLWSEFARIIGEIMPRYVFVENSPMLTVRGLGTVLRDLAKMGFDAEYGVLSARDVGGCHLRERCWILATNTSSQRCNERGSDRQERPLLHDINWIAAQSESERHGRQCGISQIDEVDVTHNRSERIQGKWQGSVYQFNSFPWGEDVRGIKDLRNRPDLPKPLLRGSNDGVAFRVERTKAIGNGQVPLCAATAFELLRQRLEA